MTTISSSHVLGYESINGTMSYTSVIDAIIITLTQPYFVGYRTGDLITKDIIGKISEWNKMRCTVLCANSGLYRNADKRLFSADQVEIIRDMRTCEEISSALFGMRGVYGITFEIE
jgi:hypothetical protein